MHTVFEIGVTAYLRTVLKNLVFMHWTTLKNIIKYSKFSKQNEPSVYIHESLPNCLSFQWHLSIWSFIYLHFTVDPENFRSEYRNSTNCRMILLRWIRKTSHCAYWDKVYAYNEIKWTAAQNFTKTMRG